MSDVKAIRAVTEKLLEIFGTITPSITTTTKTPDQIEKSPLNLFLYQIAKNPTWQNQDLPQPSKGQPARPLLALNLHYLITAGEDNQINAHEKLGKAMLKLHDNPVLSGFASDSGIKNQIDPIRIILQPLNLDEMSKLWSAFQTSYRLSATYEVSVVLIESERASPAPLPVTRRGEKGLGWDSTSQFPATLTAAKFASSNQPGVRLGEQVVLTGSNLNQSGDAQVILRHGSHKDEKKVPITRRTATEIEFRFPSDLSGFPAGLYSLMLEFVSGERKSRSSAIPISLLPEIIVPAGGLQAVAQTLQLSVRPNLAENQTVQLLIGSTLIAKVERLSDDQIKASWQVGTLPEEEKGSRFARIRVDGVDSMVFDPNKLEDGFAKFNVNGIDAP
ncbi:MAG: Pvc16 family protein [Pirellulales bacterium]